ncbi:GDSL-type esterase/lipase family protein [Pseudobacteroides cellulosolvens]|uniref:Copper amine oxidase-like domain-containing protein n=1 Tax=Pseudobacteroides cellulosolvens ATCC 35603 = DSM 2933 TaxID=398512 RepID=A0A0L6JVC8_9FIRM|nr:GDSL-type esterase/lipase family protein [Pseudobacteroides cellulosolvens]KNY29773.1 copper amine oxidase-like domain-containing protein [Pseudobacteroides cellulosolvens ATCC 35603 = DSM 2933]
MSKYIYPLIIILLTATLTITLFNNYKKENPSQKQTKISINGENLSISAPLIFEGDNILAPIEDVAKPLGAVIKSKNQNNISIAKGSTVLEFTSGSKEVGVSGKIEMLPVSIIKSKGSIMVPVRYLAEKLGADVAWDAHSKSILLTIGGKNPIVFFGDSLTENFDLNKYFPEVINKGKSGDTTFGALGRLDKVIMVKPKALFIMLGTNDVWRGFSEDITLANYRHIINIVKIASPKTQIIIQSLPPFGIKVHNFDPNTANTKISSLNKGLQSLAKELNIKFVDIGSLYKDKDGMLDTTHTSDGIHIKLSSYHKWVNAIKKYVISN